MSKHFIKPYGVAMAGILVVLGLMAWEVRAEPVLERESSCYAAASAAQLDIAAKAHRINLQPFRETSSNEVDYYIGYRLGHLTATAKFAEKPLTEVALHEYNLNCGSQM